MISNRRCSRRCGCTAAAVSLEPRNWARSPLSPPTCCAICRRPCVSAPRIFHTHSEEETIALGRCIARELPRRSVVLLIGNVGGGKTTLAKGIVQGLGAAAPEEVASPTFTLIHEYGPAVYHIDLYRLETEAEVATLGLEEIFDREAVVLIEWGERFPAVMPAERVEIRLEAEADEVRRIEVAAQARRKGG